MKCNIPLIYMHKKEGVCVSVCMCVNQRSALEIMFSYCSPCLCVFLTGVLTELGGDQLS